MATENNENTAWARSDSNREPRDYESNGEPAIPGSDAVAADLIGPPSRTKSAQAVSQLPAGNFVVTYFIEAQGVGLIKIGKAVNLQKRIAVHRCGSPVPLRVVGILRGDREREMHRRFEEDRRHGEWFYPSDVLCQFIDKRCEKSDVGPARISFREHSSHRRSTLEQMREWVELPRVGVSDLELIDLYAKAWFNQPRTGRKSRAWLELVHVIACYDKGRLGFTRAQIIEQLTPFTLYAHPSAAPLPTSPAVINGNWHPRALPTPTASLSEGGKA